MRAGLTGLAQIAGLRGDTSISERAKFDNLYIDQWSLAGDLMIMVRTFGAIIGERSRSQAQRDFEYALQTSLDANSDLVIETRARSHIEPQPLRSPTNV